MRPAASPTRLTAFASPDWGDGGPRRKGPAGALHPPTKDSGGNAVTVVGRLRLRGVRRGRVARRQRRRVSPRARRRSKSDAKARWDSPTCPRPSGPLRRRWRFSQTLGMDKLVGWRQYATTQPTGVFPGAHVRRQLPGATPKPGAEVFHRDPGESCRVLDFQQRVLERSHRPGFFSAASSSSPSSKVSREARRGLSRPRRCSISARSLARTQRAGPGGPTQNAADLGGNATDTNKRPSNYKDNRDKNTVTGTSPLQPHLQPSAAGRALHQRGHDHQLPRGTVRPTPTA